VLSSAIRVTFANVLAIVLREDNEARILPRRLYRLHVRFASVAVTQDISTWAAANGKELPLGRMISTPA